MHINDEYTKQARKVLLQVVREARAELLAASGNIDTNLKSDNSVVTELDKKMEQRFRDALESLEMQVPIVGEEGGGDTTQTDMWLIDPIDSTENFVRGLPNFRCMATLIADNQPVYTFIYKPVSDDLYEARKGFGASKNEQPIHVSTRPINRAWFIMNAPTKPRQLAIMESLHPKINKFCSGMDFVNVAEGKIEGVIACDNHGGLWDYAPRGLLLSEAGAQIANIGSDDYDFRNFDYFAAPPQMFNEIKQSIESATR